LTQASERYDSGYHEEVEKEISYFMTKKRRQVVEALYDKTRLSQGELARTIKSSAASLSNILLHFEMFQYRLLDSESEGKRRYYFLTDLGKKFVQNAYRSEQSPENENVIFHESFQNMQSVTSCLEAVKNKYKDKWEIALDDVLIEGIEYREVQIEGGEKEIDAFLHSVERVLVDDYENYSVEIMKLLYPDKILLPRLERFLAIFEVFIPILKVWQRELDSLQMFNFLESIVICDRDKAEQYIRLVQWEDETYNRLSELMQHIIEHSEKKDEAEIYRHFNRFLAGEEMLSAILAKEVHAAYRTRKEKIQEDV